MFLKIRFCAGHPSSVRDIPVLRRRSANLQIQGVGSSKFCGNTLFE
jgi:hypothetical protein